MVDNPFASDAAARRYAAGRPDYSDVAGSILHRLLGDGPLRRAVDVACGTGISTRMLASVATRIVGVDASPAMVARAPTFRGVAYVVGTAEALPLQAGSCDLVTVGSAFHWLRREAFLEEAARVAAPEARLVVHNHWFEGHMAGNDGFGEWSRRDYLRMYPTPPRHRSWQPPQDLGAWKHVAWERYAHPVDMTARQLVSYLMTQSNVQVVLERGTATETEIGERLLSEVAPFFDDEASATFLFGGYVACHRRTGH